MFDACSAHWRQLNPYPDPGPWGAIADPDERLSVALTEFYAYYARNARMLENLHRDAATMPLVARRFSRFGEYLGVVTDALMTGRGLRGRARSRARAAIGHALAFSTWRSLAGEQALPAKEAVSLMAGFVRAAATGV